jgi:deoxyhypusine synthase
MLIRCTTTNHRLQVYAEATIVFPLIVAATFAKRPP